MKKIILILILVTSFLSCSEEDLTLTSPNDVTIDDLLTSTEGFEQILVGAYDAYQKIPANEYLLTEVRTDNSTVGAEFGNLAAFNSYAITDNNVDVFDYWSNNYKVIYQSNIIIDNEDIFLALPGADQNVLGEAYFLRALGHFNLVRAFKDVPYITSVVDSDNFTDFPQLEESITYNSIALDFQTAINLLEGAAVSNTRANVGTATIYLAKSLLSQPIPDYVTAQQLLLPLISDANAYGYTLTANFDDIFGRGDAGDENNEEIIFKVVYTQSSGTPVSSDSETDSQVESEGERWSHDMSDQGISNGANIATLNLKSDMTLVKQPVRFSTTLNVDQFDEERTYNNKWVADNAEGSGNDWIALRYADVLLLYAEAVLGSADITDDATAVEAYNRVRVRAGLSAVTAFSKDQLLEERRMEFVFENQRLYDLIRFDKAVEVLQKYSDDSGLFFQSGDIYLSTPQREIDNSDGFYN